MTMNLPIFLSLLRVLIIPLLVFVFYASFWWHTILCAGMFVLAALTDALDGYLARRSQQVTQFGKMIDPIADKLIVSVAIILIAEKAGSWVVTLPVLVIITREIIISGLREWMANLGLSESVAVTGIGKAKTGLQMVAITFLLWEVPIGGVAVFEIGLGLLYASAVLTVWSMGNYILSAKYSLKSRR